ncbi:MAG: hypothetical protein WC364_15515, partial [Eubacteriales bacterium]
GKTEGVVSALKQKIQYVVDVATGRVKINGQDRSGSRVVLVSPSGDPEAAMIRKTFENMPGVEIIGVGYGVEKSSRDQVIRDVTERVKGMTKDKNKVFLVIVAGELSGSNLMPLSKDLANAGVNAIPVYTDIRSEAALLQFIGRASMPWNVSGRLIVDADILSMGVFDMANTGLTTDLRIELKAVQAQTALELSKAKGDTVKQAAITAKGNAKTERILLKAIARQEAFEARNIRGLVVQNNNLTSAQTTEILAMAEKAGSVDRAGQMKGQKIAQMISSRAAEIASGNTAMANTGFMPVADANVLGGNLVGTGVESVALSQIGSWTQNLGGQGSFDIIREGFNIEVLEAGIGTQTIDTKGGKVWTIPGLSFSLFTPAEDSKKLYAVYTDSTGIVTSKIELDQDWAATLNKEGGSITIPTGNKSETMTLTKGARADTFKLAYASTTGFQKDSWTLKAQDAYTMNVEGFGVMPVATEQDLLSALKSTEVRKYQTGVLQPVSRQAVVALLGEKSMGDLEDIFEKTGDQGTEVTFAQNYQAGIDRAVSEGTIEKSQGDALKKMAKTKKVANLSRQFLMPSSGEDVAQQEPRVQNLDITVQYRGNNILTRNKRGGLEIGVTPMIGRFANASTRARAYRMMAQTLMLNNNSLGVASLLDAVIAQQTTKEYYGYTAETADADIDQETRLAIKRANLLSSRSAEAKAQVSEYLAAVSSEDSGTGGKQINQKMADMTARRLLTSYETMVDIYGYIAPSFVYNDSYAQDFAQQVEQIRQNQGTDAVARVIAIAQNAKKLINDGVTPLSFRQRYILTKLAELAEPENEAKVRNLISAPISLGEGLYSKESGAGIRLLLPEEMTDRDQGRAAYSSDKHEVQVSMINLDLTGKISDKT